MSAPLRLLVVDDDAQMLELLELSLSLQGFVVETASSGAQAVQLCQTHPFDLIVMDVLMAPLDGFETVQLLRTLLEQSLPPVVYLSGLNSEEHMPRYPDHRSAFLIKPFRPSQLANLIRAVVPAP